MLPRRRKTSILLRKHRCAPHERECKHYVSGKIGGSLSAKLQKRGNHPFHRSIDGYGWRRSDPLEDSVIRPERRVDKEYLEEKKDGGLRKEDKHKQKTREQKFVVDNHGPSARTGDRKSVV